MRPHGGTRWSRWRADQDLVESRLTGGGVPCPECPGVLGPWGWARRRDVRGVRTLQPRHGRCSSCLVTHVLLPVTVLLRRADAAAVIWAALVARAAGHGHRAIAALVGASASTVPGWSRRMSTRLEPVRVHFTVLARPCSAATPSLIHNAARGYPRAVNKLAINTLTAAFARNQAIVDEKSARAAIAETGGDQAVTLTTTPSPRPPKAPPEHHRVGPFNTQIHRQQQRRQHRQEERRSTRARRHVATSLRHRAHPPSGAGRGGAAADVEIAGSSQVACWPRSRPRSPRP